MAIKLHIYFVFRIFEDITFMNVKGEGKDE